MSCTRRHADGGTTNATRATCFGIDRIVSSPKRLAIRQLRHAFATSHSALGETQQRRCLWMPQAAIRLQRSLLVHTRNDNENGLSAQLRDDIATFARQSDEHTAREMALLEKWIQQSLQGTMHRLLLVTRRMTTTRTARAKMSSNQPKSRHHRCICQCLRGVVATACQAIRGLSPWVLDNPSRQHESHLTLPEPPTHLD
jgi:hypothetical protein